MLIVKMKEQRAEAVKAARAILDKVDEENRSLSAEEKEQYDKHWEDIETMKDNIGRAESLEIEERALEASADVEVGLETAGDPSKTAKGGEAGPEIFDIGPNVMGEARSVVLSGEQATQGYTDLFRRFLIGGPNALIGVESRALQMDDDTGGGFLSAPQRFQAELIKALDDTVSMRRICRVLPPLGKAASLGVPTLEADPSDPTWTSELAIGNEDTTMEFGKRELNPHPLAKYIKVSKTLIRRATLPVDTIVRDRLAYKNGIAQENNFLNGNGAAKPLGIFVASNDGVPTSRDFGASDNTATEIRVDGLKECQYGLKAGYRANARWMFHRDAVKQISKLKDSDGQYLWQASVQEGQPDRLLKMPIEESEYAPNTFTASKYVGVLADFRHYWIVDALTMTIQVLFELHAGKNQNGYLSRSETDGMPVLAEAFARLKLAAA